MYGLVLILAIQKCNKNRNPMNLGRFRGVPRIFKIFLAPPYRGVPNSKFSSMGGGGGVPNSKISSMGGGGCQTRKFHLWGGGGAMRSSRSAPAYFEIHSKQEQENRAGKERNTHFFTKTSEFKNKTIQQEHKLKQQYRSI